MQAFYDLSILFHLVTTIIGLAMLWRLVDRVTDMVKVLERLREGQQEEIEATHNVARRR